MEQYFGVDIGGTAVKWALVAEDYGVLKNGEFATPYEGAEELADAVAAVYREQGAGAKGIGVSIPGTLRDDPDGIVEGGGVLKTFTLPV